MSGHALRVQQSSVATSSALDSAVFAWLVVQKDGCNDCKKDGTLRLGYEVCLGGSKRVGSYLRRSTTCQLKNSAMKRVIT
jgi:hypothetical protein